MSWETIRGMTGESFIEWCERNDYDLSSDSARRLLIEAKALLKEHGRVVELLKQVGNNRDELWESGHDELFENIEEFLRELEGK